MGNTDLAAIQQARAAMKAGDRQQARLILQQAIRQNVDDYVAWAWLATVTASPQASLGYARRAEKLSPDDPLVRKVLAWAERRLLEAAQHAPEAAEPAEPEVTAGRPRWRTLALWSSGVALLVIVAVSGILVAWSALDTGQERSPTAVSVQADIGRIERDFQEPPPAVPTATPPRPTATPTPTPQRIRAKNIAASAGTEKSEPRPTWTVTPSPTNTPVPTPTPMPTFVSPQNDKPVSRPFGVGIYERWIDVDLSEQSLTAYEGNEPVYSALVSSGTWQHPTVTGQFRIWVRYRSQTMDGRRLGYNYYLENVPYVMYFFEDYALHGTYWHNNFGTPMSHGCVNLRTSDAEWIFNWSSLGTLVNVHQ